MHATEQTTAILVRVPMIQGCLTFKGLWDMQVRLLEILNTIKHANHPLEEMAGKIVKAGAYALVSTTPWTVPDQVGEFFQVPIIAITDTDQRTEERKWTAKKTSENNDNNLDTCLVVMWTWIIPQAYHTGGNTL